VIFSFKPVFDASDTLAEIPTFTVGRLWQQGAEISHLIDRSYGYHSARELRWHLADRFGVPVTSVMLSKVLA
jgi:hypothetical protein